VVKEKINIKKKLRDYIGKLSDFMKNLGITDYESHCYLRIIMVVFLLAFVLITISIPIAADDNSVQISEDDQKKLDALGYMTWVPVKDKSKAGVTLHDKNQACSGINIYSSRNLSKAYLMDMYGKILHTWSLP